MLNEKIDLIKKEVENTTIVAATKYVDTTDMRLLLEKGINNFGENRVDAFLQKYEELKDCEDIIWHFIGNLQTNKVKSMINKISYLHSLNSLHLAKYINQYRIEPLNCFIEININNEKSKEGINLCDLLPFLQEVVKYQKVNVIGLMCISCKDDSDKDKLISFQKMDEIRTKLNLMGYDNIKYLSMGMSDDYHLAIIAHTNFVRLGRILFTNYEVKN